jgi:hypothetical protein
MHQTTHSDVIHILHVRIAVAYNMTSLRFVETAASNSAEIVGRPCLMDDLHPKRLSQKSWYDILRVIVLVFVLKWKTLHRISSAVFFLWLYSHSGPRSARVLSSLSLLKLHCLLSKI